jgi:hypothetical protein
MVGNDAYLPMSIDWVPDSDSFAQMAQLVGLIDKEYTQEDVGEFVLYWMGQANKHFTPYQWHQKFVMNMKRKRTARGHSNIQVVGNQLVTTKAALVVDDNARALVKKYGQQKP